ncbi:hypothetical protein HOY80DRAFT_657374, partial [Tuber brumale]
PSSESKNPLLACPALSNKPTNRQARGRNLSSLMATHPSRIPLPTSGNRKRRKQPRCHHHHHSAPNIPPKAWELYIQSRRAARQDRLWQDEGQEKLCAFKAARAEHESLGVHFLHESDNPGPHPVNTCFSGDGIGDSTSGLFSRGMEEEEGGGSGRPWRFTDDVYPTRVPVWERRERKISPLVPLRHPQMQRLEKPGDQQPESIEAMLERCRGVGNYRKRLEQREFLGMRRKEFLSEEISLFERVLVEGKMVEVGFPVHKDRE